MTTSIQPTHAIEHLDFDVRCETLNRVRVLRWWLNTAKCRRSAKWMAVLPCCGLQVFSCNRHRKTERGVAQECAGCGRFYWGVETWKWVRL